MKHCILIQTTDSYDFLWEGLYLSWKLNWNWKSFPWEVYIITEEKNFTDVIPEATWFKNIKIGKELEGPEHYSTKLIKSLAFLRSQGYDAVFYSQDDSWPQCPIDADVLKPAMNFFQKEEVLGLLINESRDFFPFTLQDTPFKICGKKLKKFYGASRFFFNHGTAFWKINGLLKFLVPGEAPYENEWKTTERMWKQNPNVYILNYPWYDQDLIHQKGVFLDSGKKMIANLKFRNEWETVPCFMMKYHNNPHVKMTEEEKEYYKEEQIQELS